MSPATLGTPLLSVRDLSVAFAESDGAVIRAADHVSFDVMPGEALGIVGESGSGKSVTLRSLIGVQSPGSILGGHAVMSGSRDLIGLSDKELTTVRGSAIGMIFQDAGSAFNPMLSIGAQIQEVLMQKRGMSRRAASTEAIALLDRVGIPAASRRIHDYPHQLSGGMRQRAMIAMALAPKPLLLLADEPTTALDVTIQAQVLDLLCELRREDNLAMILVSHDLGVIAQECDTILVMYAGRALEYGSADEVLDEPRHPCTEALMAATLPARPSLERRPLGTIPGQTPSLSSLPPGCSFAPRCKYADEHCKSASMTLDREPPAHGSACIDPGRMKR